MFEIRLTSGRAVRVAAVSAAETYGGLLEGRPTAAYNAKLVAGAHTAMERLWGTGRATFVVPPPPGRMPRALHPELPAETWHAWLTSAPLAPAEPGEAGSELVVAWFRGDSAGLTLPEIVTEGVRTVPWDEVAANWVP